MHRDIHGGSQVKKSYLKRQGIFIGKEKCVFFCLTECTRNKCNSRRMKRAPFLTNMLFRPVITRTKDPRRRCMNRGVKSESLLSLPAKYANGRKTFLEFPTFTMPPPTITMSVHFLRESLSLSSL